LWVRVLRLGRRSLLGHASPASCNTDPIHRPGAPTATQTRPCDTPMEPGAVGARAGTRSTTPAAWGAVGKAEHAGQNLKIMPSQFLHTTFCTLNGARRRGGRSVGVIFVGVAWAHVCMLHGVRTLMHASPAPPDRLVVIGGVLGTCPASFSAGGAREGSLRPQNTVLAVHTCVAI
jgi:hypothetical protein